MEFLSGIEYWHWFAFGAFLILLEIFVPSAIFLWPGIAALVAGLFAFLIPSINPVLLIFLWAALSAALAYGWQLYRKKRPAIAPMPTMNRRGEEYVGRHFTLEQDIVNGSGTLHVSDTRWKIICAKDLPNGMKVKVVGVEGTSLRVEEYID